jgi:hypothetical protein
MCWQSQGNQGQILENALLVVRFWKMVCDVLRILQSPFKSNIELNDAI